jgi:hypothetical protein
MIFRIEIDPLLLNYQWPMQNLCVNGPDIFRYDSEEKQLDSSEEEEPNHQWRQTSGKALPVDQFVYKIE